MRRLAILSLALTAAPTMAAAPITGRWLTDDKDAVVEIGQCGGQICGRVARVIKRLPNGQIPVDANNPDPKLRGRSVQGMMTLLGFTDGGSVWNGRIYDPRNGKTYNSKLSRNANGTLKVQGCIAFLCKAFNWLPVR